MERNTPGTMKFVGKFGRVTRERAQDSFYFYAPFAPFSLLDYANSIGVKKKEKRHFVSGDIGYHMLRFERVNRYIYIYIYI